MNQFVHIYMKNSIEKIKYRSIQIYNEKEIINIFFYLNQKVMNIP